MTGPLRNAIGTAIAGVSGCGDRSKFEGEVRAVGGGHTAAAWRWRDADRTFFVKTMPVSKGTAGMLSAEADGLVALGEVDGVRVPAVVASGEEHGFAFLVLDWLDLVPDGNGARAGRSLACLHAKGEPGGRFGWRRDNFIGGSVQRNTWCDSWTEFFVGSRLLPQLLWAGVAEKRCAGVLSAVRGILSGHSPQASLLHGDLWRGNSGFLRGAGEAVFFDPAVYYGDRETDLAFSELFGGFDRTFYSAYREEANLPDGYEVRREVYNLYHVLNHWNLFGGGYAAQAEAMMHALLK